MSPKQKQRTLPSLLYKSFFYTIKDYTPSFQENFRPRDILVNSMLVLKPIRHCHHSMDYTVCKGNLHFRFPHFVSHSVNYGRALVLRISKTLADLVQIHLSRKSTLKGGRVYCGGMLWILWIQNREEDFQRRLKSTIL